jgi:hypothetical protein
MGLVITILKFRKVWEWMEKFKGGWMSVVDDDDDDDDDDVCPEWPMIATYVKV